MWRWTEIDVTLSPVLTAPRSKECLMTFIAVRCPHCHSEQIVKRGKTGCGTQRYLCQNTGCAKGSFLLDYRNQGCVPEVKQSPARQSPPSSPSSSPNCAGCPSPNTRPPGQ